MNRFNRKDEKEVASGSVTDRRIGNCGCGTLS